MMSHLSSKITNTKSSSTMFAPTPILPVWLKLTNLAKKGSLGHSWLNSPHPIPLPTVAIEFPIGQQVSPPQPQHDGSICNLEQYKVKEHLISLPLPHMLLSLTYTKAYEQCSKWDGHPHPLPCPLLHFSSLLHTMHMRYLDPHFPTNHMGLFKPYSLLTV